MRPLANMLSEGLEPQSSRIGGRCTVLHDPRRTVEMFDTWHGRWVTCRAHGLLRALLLVRPKHAGGKGGLWCQQPAGRLADGGGGLRAARHHLRRAGLLRGLGSEQNIVKLVMDGQIFSPSKQEWRFAGARAPGVQGLAPRREAKLRRARWGHGCAFLAGRVFCVGGCSPDAAAPEGMATLRSCEAYDPRSETWSPPAPGPRKAGGTEVRQPRRGTGRRQGGGRERPRAGGRGGL